jgi:hypothetical protein
MKNIPDPPGENYMRCILACLSLIVLSSTPVFAGNSITYYRDGALLQLETVATKGVIEVPLAADLLENSLNVVPASGTTILGVETIRKESANQGNNEREALTEQRRRLEDRLQALETREAIFTSAAKAQSGKAPRKTKANPDPMQAIRQGTDFAIAQLEAVYTARRKTNNEIQKIDNRLAAAKKVNPVSENNVRIIVTPSKGKVTIRYATTERGWQPLYNLHLAGNGTAQLQLSALISGSRRGYQTRVTSGSLAESASLETLAAQNGTALLASYRLPIMDEQYSDGIFKRYSGKLTNSSQRYLPAGESCLYRDGTYLGKFRFEGISSGRSRSFLFGK